MEAVSGHSARDFYDQLSADYHLVYPDWDASLRRQGTALDALVRREWSSGEADLLDCSCGIGTQAIGLALHGHRVVGADLSPVAARRAVAEAELRDLALPGVAAVMRALPFTDSSFDVVLSADNSVAHLLTDADLRAALAGMRRVLRAGGPLVLTLKDYEEARVTHRATTVPQVTSTDAGRAVTFQLWDWHEDGVRYDFEHVQLLPSGPDGAWEVRVRRATSRAWLRAELAAAVAEAGFEDVRWHLPDETGFFQPVLTARRALP